MLSQPVKRFKEQADGSNCEFLADVNMSSNVRSNGQ